MNIYKKIRGFFQKSITDDFQWRRTQLAVLLLVLGIISGGMSVMNIVTKQHGLLISTAVFCVFSLASSYVAFKEKYSQAVAGALFTVEVMGLFTYFILSGGTEGFSTIWLLLLPACGMFAFGMKKGCMLTGALFVELVFFFYTPVGNDLLLCDDYTQAFLLRFPLVYVAFWGIGCILELVRDETYRQLEESRKKYEYLSDHDVLTAMFNRAGFNREVDRAVEGYAEGIPFALMIMDLDRFKMVNDTYGHTTGDVVLRSAAKTISDCLQEKNAVACRWGGEEFAVLLYGDDSEAFRDLAESIRASVEKTVHDKVQDVHITVSIGAVHTEGVDLSTAAQMVLMADRMLYQAKQKGRNQVRCYN